MNEKIYITTPIYYANGSPHIGHFTTTTIADAVARYYRNKNGTDSVFFTTGLDEHGTTVQAAAEKAGIKDYKKYTDEKAEEWKQAFDNTAISYDYFVRTTNPEHEKFSQQFIQKMIDACDVYKNKYKGKYCWGCEKFLTLSDLNEEGLCPLHRPDQVVEIEEENYFFKLSKYASRVKELIESGEITIIPQVKRNEILARIEQGIDDISISRPKEKVSWGVEFPNDSGQTVYVWVEALINYLSSLEINKKDASFWESVVHLVGKDISWFHNVIWPAMLISAGYKVPKRSFVHGYLQIGGQKISKSLGNAISPQQLVEQYGIDGARYLTLANIPYKDDSDVTLELLDTKYNADLANGLGNLISRLTKLCENNGKEYKISLSEFAQNYKETLNQIDNLVSEFKLHEVCKLLENTIAELNKEFNEVKPWEDLDNSKDFLESVLNKTIYVINMFGFLLPQTQKNIFEHFGIESANDVYNVKVNHLTGLFQRK